MVLEIFRWNSGKFPSAHNFDSTHITMRNCCCIESPPLRQFLPSIRLCSRNWRATSIGNDEKFFEGDYYRFSSHLEKMLSSFGFIFQGPFPWTIFINSFQFIPAHWTILRMTGIRRINLISETAVRICALYDLLHDVAPDK